MKSKKTMFLTALAAGSLLAWSPALRADDATNAPPASPSTNQPLHTMHGPAQIAKALDLTDDQKPKVKSVLDAQTQKMRDLHSSPDFSSLSREDKAAKMKAIHDDTVAQMKDILTPDQFAKWQKMTQMHHRGGPPQGGDNAGAPATTPAAPPQQ